MSENESFNVNPSSCQWDLGGVSVQIGPETKDLPLDWTSYFSAYQTPTTDKTSDVVLNLHPVAELTNPSFSSELGLKSWPSESNPQVIRYKHVNLSGNIVIAKNQCSGDFVLTEDITAFDRTLFIAASHSVYQNGMILLHASAVEVDSKVWIFCGRSGAGKTTIATELRGDGKTFSIDRTVLFINDRNELLAYPTPFSDLDGITKSKAATPVAGIVFIEQANETAVTSLCAIDSMKRLLRNTSVLPYMATKDRQGILDLSGEIIQIATCCDLRFTKDTGFWNYLEKVKQ